MSRDNERTLVSYGLGVDAYIRGTNPEVAGPVREWIDEALRGLPANARILEIGSAFGRDAAYMRSLGFAVECSDAVPEFVDMLQEKGFDARLLNILSDEIGDGYDLILANAVFHHFPRSELGGILVRMRHALAPDGRLAFTVKSGDGEEWSSEKIGSPRYFCYWRAAEVDSLLGDAGFTRTQIRESRTDRAHADWIFALSNP